MSSTFKYTASESEITALQHEYNRARLFTMLPMGLYGNDKTRVARMMRAMATILDLEKAPKDQLFARTFNRLRSMGMADTDATKIANLLAEGNVDAFSNMLLQVKPHGVHAMIQEFVVAGMLSPAGTAANAIGNLVMQAMRIGAEKPVTSWLDAARVMWARAIGLGDVVGLGTREYVQAPANLVLAVLREVIPQGDPGGARDAGPFLVWEPSSQ